MEPRARRSVQFEEAAGEAGEGEKKDGGMGRSDFLNTFADFVARRDYKGAQEACRTRLKAKPDDRYALQLRQSVETYLDSAEDLDDGDDAAEEPPLLEDLREEADAACGRAYEAMFAYLQDEEHLWAMGEQAVGIFWDSGQLAPWGKRRERLREMARSLTEAVGRRLQVTEHQERGSASTSVGADLGTNEWLFEGLGLLWWQRELGLAAEEWLLEGCRKEWAGRSMEDLVGFSAEGLSRASLDQLSDILMQTLTLERSGVCGLFGELPLPPLEYGVGAVLAEIQRRPLVEPPLEGFYSCFYLMTQVVRALNSFNGYLPSRRADCPWLYGYLERCMGFWLREVRQDRSTLPDAVAASTWGAEAVDAVAEAADCLRGLDEENEMEAVRAGIAWLLTRQDADGLFYSPSAERPAPDEYSHLHPTWTAVEVLQLDREMPGPSPRSACWARHARQSAEGVGFARAPPLPHLGKLPAAEEDDAAGEVVA